MMVEKKSVFGKSMIVGLILATILGYSNPTISKVLNNQSNSVKMQKVEYDLGAEIKKLTSKEDFENLFDLLVTQYYEKGSIFNKDFNRESKQTIKDICEQIFLTPSELVLVLSDPEFLFPKVNWTKLVYDDLPAAKYYFKLYSLYAKVSTFSKNKLEKYSHLNGSMPEKVLDLLEEDPFYAKNYPPTFIKDYLEFMKLRKVYLDHSVKFFLRSKPVRNKKIDIRRINRKIRVKRDAQRKKMFRRSVDKKLFRPNKKQMPHHGI